MKTYKYWLFHLNPKYRPGGEDSQTTLYAYTDSKELATMFKKQRDMSKFVVKKKELTREDVSEIARNYGSYILEKVEGICRVAGTTTSIGQYEMAITRLERITIQNMHYSIRTTDLQRKTWMSPFILDDKYLESLQSIGYLYFYSQVIGNEVSGDSSGMDAFDRRFVIDDYAIFCDTYYFTTILMEGE